MDDWSIRSVWGRREYMSGQLKVCGEEGWMMVHYRCVGKEGLMTGKLEVCGGGGSG